MGQRHSKGFRQGKQETTPTSLVCKQEPPRNNAITVRAFCSIRKTIKILVHPGDKVSDLKPVIEEELHVPCDQQRLFLHDGELEDDEHALSRLSDGYFQRDVVLIQRDIDNVLFIITVSKHSRMHIIHFNPSDSHGC